VTASGQVARTAMYNTSKGDKDGGKEDALCVWQQGERLSPF
jgi:hypothetical protein